MTTEEDPIIAQDPIIEGGLAEDAIVEGNPDLSRPQKRMLKRLYNARAVPIMVDDRAFLTYRDAARYLLSLPMDAREAAYAVMKAHVKDKTR
ncbi:hypothetical protein [Sphingobium sp.]|uniref:hypothetical protein n=1 Tax=Sphingobium sp. TaxID=1912891 RepID=UPI0026191085|nr:hypothetical protein [Sphingobium sp.]